MFAVIETGGKQYLVKSGTVLKVEKLEIEAGKDFAFENVLMIASDDGATVEVGTPYLKGVTVAATVIKHARAKKVRVVKYKRKVRYKRANGHRQHYTEVKIKEVK